MAKFEEMSQAAKEEEAKKAQFLKKKATLKKMTPFHNKKDLLKKSQNLIKKMCSNKNIAKAVSKELLKKLSRESLNKRSRESCIYHDNKKSGNYLKKSISKLNLNKIREEEKKTEMQNYLISHVLFDGQEEVSCKDKEDLEEDLYFETYKSEMEKYLSLFDDNETKKKPKSKNKQNNKNKGLFT